MASKFIIDKVVIESTPKDIETGAIREFCEGFNLILGNNEKGKSSLMNFIKEGFFKTKGTESGKIFFKIQKDNGCFNYRADIKQTKTLQAQRLEIIDENNNKNVDYSIIKNVMDETYFKQGFTINLDDLMMAKTKENDAFINAIKDPCADKLKMFLDKSEQALLNVLTDKKKPNAKTKGDIEQINRLNLEIKELSKKETEYNDIIRELGLLEDSVKELTQKQIELEASKKSLILCEEIRKLQNESNDLNLLFNSKLFDNKEKYFDILETKSTYEANLDSIEKNNLKIKSCQETILINKSELKNNYFIEYDIDSILNISFDYDKNKKIKEIIKKTDELKEEIKTNLTKKSLLEEDILKLKVKKNSFKKENEFSCDDLSILNSKLDEGLELTRFLACEIEKEETCQKTRVFDKKSIYLFSGIVVSGILAFGFGVYSKLTSVIIFSLFVSLIALFGIINHGFLTKNGKSNKEINNKKNKRKDILNNLKRQVSALYPEILNACEFELAIKLENIKRDITDKIKESELYKKEFSQNEEQLKEKETLSLELDKKNTQNEELIEKYNLEGIELVDKNLYFKGFELRDFENIFEIIKSLKNNLEQKSLLEKENEELKNKNNIFIESFKNFVLQNDVKIAFSDSDFDDLSSFVVSLKEQILKNDEIKTQLDFKNKEIELKKTQIENCKKEIYTLDFEVNLENVDDKIKDISSEKELRQMEKEQALIAKSALENFEGMTGLLFQRQQEIYKYQNKIKTLFVNEMILLLSKMAKDSFDKNQPDLLNAQKYLSCLTDNRYSKINLELKEISSEDDSLIKNWQDLSRGTKEQLYFALRLAYASNYSKDKNTLETGIRPDLPFVVDDAFVNFDAKRAKNALRCLFDFSKTNQVLFFTCHNELVLKYIEEINCADKTNKIVLS